VNWADLTMGRIILPGHKFGMITPKDSYFTVELRGLTDTLRAHVGEVTGPLCRVDLFGAECGLNSELYKQSGTVVTTDGKKIITVSGIGSSVAALVEETLTVDPKSPPWNFVGGINAAFDFGEESTRTPTICTIPLSAGWLVGIYYQSGYVKISSSSGRPFVDAAGQVDDITGDTTGTSGNFFPTHYIPGSQLGKGGLVWAFTDAAGNVIPGGIGNLGPLDGTVASVVFNSGQLQLNTGFIQDGRRGNSGGGDGTIIGLMTPGSPANFHVAGIDAYDNAYWYIKWPGLSSAMSFVHKMKVRLPTTGDRAACRCIEWEIQKSFNGKIYNMAWQINFASSEYKTFTKVYPLPGHWDDSGIAFDGSIYDAGAWVELESIFELTDTTVTHVSLRINGTLHTVNITRTAPTHSESTYISTAFQLDEDGNTPPTPYNCEVDNWSVVMYAAGGANLGLSGTFIVPTGATRLQLGINDDIFGDNLGAPGPDNPTGPDGFIVTIQVDKGLSGGTPDFTQFESGRILFTSGDNEGYTTEIKTGSNSPAYLKLYLATPFAIQPGDTFDIWPGCDKQPSTCKTIYKNLVNFRGQKFLPGVDAVRQTPLIKLK
jgi:hypothetical protein